MISQFESILKDSDRRTWKETNTSVNTSTSSCGGGGTLATGVVLSANNDNEERIPSPLTTLGSSSSSFMEDDESIASNISRLRAKQKLLRLHTASKLAESKRRLSQNWDAMSVTSHTTLSVASSSSNLYHCIPQHVVVTQQEEKASFTDQQQQQRLISVLHKELVATKRIIRGFIILLIMLLLLLMIGFWQMEQVKTFVTNEQSNNYDDVAVHATENATANATDSEEHPAFLEQDDSSSILWDMKIRDDRIAMWLSQ